MPTHPTSTRSLPPTRSPPPCKRPPFHLVLAKSSPIDVPVCSSSLPHWSPRPRASSLEPRLASQACPCLPSLLPPPFLWPPLRRTPCGGSEEDAFNANECAIEGKRNAPKTPRSHRSVPARARAHARPWGGRQGRTRSVYTTPGARCRAKAASSNAEKGVQAHVLRVKVQLWDAGGLQRVVVLLPSAPIRLHPPTPPPNLLPRATVFPTRCLAARVYTGAFRACMFIPSQ